MVKMAVAVTTMAVMVPIRPARSLILTASGLTLPNRTRHFPIREEKGSTRLFAFLDEAIRPAAPVSVIRISLSIVMAFNIAFIDVHRSPSPSAALMRVREEATATRTVSGFGIHKTPVLETCCSAFHQHGF